MIKVMKCSIPIFLLLLVESSLTQEESKQEKIKFAKIYMMDHRVFEGQITREDEESITLKTDFVTAPFPKDEILNILRYELTPQEVKERKKAKNTYTSLLLGYRITKPEDWNFKLDPPEPLSDLLIRNYSQDFEIAVLGMPDRNPDTPFNEQFLQAVAQVVEGRLREKFLDVKRISTEQTQFKDKPAFFLNFSLKKKSNKKEYQLGETIFRHDNKILWVAVWAPVKSYEKAKKIYDETLATFEFTQIKLQEGNRLYNPEYLFILEKPQDWSFDKVPEKDAGQAQVIIKSKDKVASVTIEVKRTEQIRDLKGWAKSVGEELSRTLKDARKVSEDLVYVCNRSGRKLVFEHSSDAKQHAQRTVYLFPEDDRRYQVSVEWIADFREIYQPIVSEILSNFRVLNDLQSEGALERGLKAIDLADEADKKLLADQYKESINLYEQAVEIFPRFASAYNNMGVAQMQMKNLPSAYRSLQQAFQLFSEDPDIRENLAVWHLHKANGYLEANKLQEAATDAKKAHSLAENSEQVKGSVCSVYANIGVYYANKENYDSAISWFKRALQIKPKDADLSKNLSIIYTNGAVSSFNKGNKSRALSWAKEALKYDAQNTKAKEIINLIEKKK